MPMTTVNVRVSEWSDRFREAPLARSVVADLRERSAEIWQRTFDLLQQESPEYRNSVDDEFTSESKSHCGELLNTIIAVAAGRAARSTGDPFGFVRTHAEWRARHQVPLTASLHAYRLAHKTYWGITRESLVRHARREEALDSMAMLSDFWIEFFDYVGAVLAEAHAVEEGLNVVQNTRAYVGLIEDLLRGVGPRDAEGQRLRTLCGIRPGAPMAVIVARPFQSGNGREIDLEVTLRALVRLIRHVLPSAVFGKLVNIRNSEVTAILCSDRDTSRRFLKVLRKHGFGRRASNGLAAGVGASLDAVDIAGLPQSLEEARLALGFTNPAQPLGHFADIDLQQYLIGRADAIAIRLIPEGMLHLNPAGAGSAKGLSRTISVFTDCSLNVKQTARRLGVHTNTVYFRLNQIKRLTGIDPRTFSGASLLLTALRLLETRASG
jgi:PucR C-terminal helix-turn-helix domain/GGDEF-like domain